MARKEFRVVVENAGAMPEKQFQAWAVTYCRHVLELDAEERTTMKKDAIYINRGEHGFERYAGTRETLAMVGWPSIFTGRLQTNQVVSVAPAIRYLRTHERTGLHLVSMDEPDDATWQALERHVSKAPAD